MNIQQDKYALSITDQLMAVLNAEIAKTDKDLSGGVILSFKDPDYSAEAGGYHPVEICINWQGRIQYITDFAFVGHPYPELAKELDFDFSLGLFQQFGRDFPIDRGYELFAIWQQNFCTFYQQGIFTVTASI